MVFRIMEPTITVTESARNFSNVIHRVVYRGEPGDGLEGLSVTRTSGVPKRETLSYNLGFRRLAPCQSFKTSSVLPFTR